jgi:thiaminase
MTQDPVYLANVSSACMDALREAQDMAEAGETGAELADVVRHARELYDIIAEELGDVSRATGEYAGGVLLEFDERIKELERLVRAKSH